MTTTLFLVCGASGAGKDTVCDFLGVSKYSFAAPMKAICGKVFALSDDQLFDPVEKNAPFPEAVVLTRDHVLAVAAFAELDTSDLFGKYEGTTFESPRRIMQFVGTEIIRAAGGADWHAEALVRSLDLPVACVSDGRFLNEFEYLASHPVFGNSLVPIFVDREGSALQGEAASHASEADLPQLRELVRHHPRGVIISNNGSLDSLRTEVSRLT